MAAATDVQFFSHLNAGCPQLTNDWGCMISLLDACLVNGVSLPNVSSVTVATGGNITVNFASAHSVLLFQCVTLAGFTPSILNGKYRVIGVPTTTQLTLSSDLSAQSATTTGTAKISPLGYQIAYSGTGKRAYRALNPTAQHPYIRVDESLTSPDGTTGIYTSTYAKYAMVGLIANMSHIDDYLDTSKLQLPLDTTDFSKNWKIAGTGSSVVRGWSRWYWARYTNLYQGGVYDVYAPSTGNRKFTLVGNADAFYINRGLANASDNMKGIMGCGLYDSGLPTDIVPNWFLLSALTATTAQGTDYMTNISGAIPFVYSATVIGGFSTKYNVTNPIVSHINTTPVVPDYTSGYSAIYSANNVSALQIPFYDGNAYLRGTYKHIYYAGNNKNTLTVTTPILADNSMYIWDCAFVSGSSSIGGFYFYLGEMS